MREIDRQTSLSFVVDDLGWADVSANNPDTFYDTPNVQRISDAGVRFTNGYAACSVCSPSRAALLTGRYPQRCGVTDYIGPGGGNQPENWRRDTVMLPAPYADRMAHEEVTIAEILRDAGYATFIAGKWHLGPESHFPETQGFDVNKGGVWRGGPYGGDKYFSPYGNERLEDGPDGEHLPDRLGRETAAFIAEHKDRPFLAYLSFYSVHTPLMAREDLRAKYESRREEFGLSAEWGQEGQRRVRLNQEHAVYAGMVEAMDQAVGVVLDAIDDHGLAEDTIIVFTSDNGGLSTSEGSPTSNMPLRGGKGWIYEGGIREPFVVAWKGRIEAGVSERAVCGIDLLPTILDLCELEAPADLLLDGVSIRPELSGGEIGSRALFWHYPHYGNQGGFPAAAVRMGNLKLIQSLETGDVQLYDLDADPGEALDLAPTRPRDVLRLHGMLRVWQMSVGARSLGIREGVGDDR